MILVKFEVNSKANINKRKMENNDAQYYSIHTLITMPLITTIAL